MATRSRSSKRKRDAEETTKPPEEIEVVRVEETTKARKKSGYPFIDEEVEWTYERLELLPMARKVIPAGYETLAGDVNTLLTKKMSVANANIVRNSSMGQFTRLDASTIRCGRMMHYVVCHQVVPEPNFDPTALFFKFGRRVLRFSRVEYALVSGLKFGPSTFDPYGEQTLPPNSTYERLFGANPGTRLSDVRTSFVDRTFMVKGEEVEATPEDWVKLSKLLLCLGFALGVDTTKKKIPLWMWVLLENEEEWENFPWGSLSYQMLLEAIRGIPKEKKGKAKINYGIKGNTVAFCAWIFEAFPTFGKVVGLRGKDTQIPRFVQYSFVKERRYPKDEEITEGLVRRLKPTEEEKLEGFWISLSDDPETKPFAFKYDPSDALKKRTRGGDDADAGEEDQDGEAPKTELATVSHAQISAAAETAAANAVGKSLEQMKLMFGEFEKNLLKGLAKKVAKEVGKILLEAPEPHNYYEGGAGYGEDEVIEDTPVAAQGVPRGLDELVANTPVQPTKLFELGEPSMFSLGLTQEKTSEKAPQPAIATAPAAAQATAPATAPAAAAPSATAPAASAPTAPTAATAPTAPTVATATTAVQQVEGMPLPLPEVNEQEQESFLTDTQIDREYDKLEIVEAVEQHPVLRGHTKSVRPKRIMYPSRVCRSPFLRADRRPAPDKFRTFLQDANELRNVGLHDDVDRGFFEQILKERSELLEDHVTSYLGVVCSNPTLAGLRSVDQSIGVTCCFFMCEVESVFETLHQKPESGEYNYDLFDPSVEENIPDEEMERLLVFTNGSYPAWGENVKEWIEYEKVVVVCSFGSTHKDDDDGIPDWATVVINMEDQILTIHDPRAFTFDKDDKKMRLNTFLPMARLVPQMMKKIGYFEKHNMSTPQYAQWEITFGPSSGRNAYRAKFKEDSALCCMKYVERFLGRTDTNHALRTKEEIKDYRFHVAKTIYSNSTDATTIPMILDDLPKAT